VDDPASVLQGELVSAFEALYTGLRQADARFEQHGAYVFVSCPRLPLPSFNGVWSGDDDTAAAVALERELARVRATGVPPGVVARDDGAPRLLGEARKLGLTETMAVPGMIVTPAGFRPAGADGVEIEASRDEAALAEASEVMAAGFEAPAEWFRLLNGSDQSTVYVLRAGGRAVSAALSFPGKHGVGIFNVATPKEHRGRGYGAAVTSRAVADGLAVGAGFAFLQSSAIGESVYRRLGFEQVSSYTIASEPSG